MHDSPESWDDWNAAWRNRFEQFATQEMAGADVSHDISHVRRVVENARRLGVAERARAAVVLPAAWLHDCVSVPKDSPNRSRASRLASERATEFLQEIGYSADSIAAIAHAILAHSFSAQVPPETIEAQVVQDADRLEALGALGLARCLMTGGALGQRLFDPDEPFPVSRVADESKQSIDHFFCKLLRLPTTMQTVGGKLEAVRRSRVLLRFLEDLAEEINCPKERLNDSLARMYIPSAG